LSGEEPRCGNDKNGAYMEDLTLLVKIELSHKSIGIVHIVSRWIESFSTINIVRIVADFG